MGAGRFITGVVFRPVTTAMVTITLLLFGLVAATRLPVDLLPDLSYPSITVQTDYADAAPEEIEELVTRPIEELVGAVPGVIAVESVSREGVSEVVLDFAWGTRIDTAMADVREKLDRARLPLETERPVVLRYDPSQEPIIRLALTAPQGDEGAATDLSRLRLQADKQVKRELEKLPGVAAVSIHGGDQDEIRVELDTGRLAALGVRAQEVVDAINGDHVNRPAGALTQNDRRYLIRTVNEARSAEDVAGIALRSSADGGTLYVRDVATVVRGPIEREELAIIDGREAIELAVYREGDANTVAVARRVRDRLQGFELAQGQRLVILGDQARFIEGAVDEVITNVLVGGVLAILVLLFFLRDLRSTVVIAVAIPVSLLAAFVPLHALGVSLNLMSLGGLALGVGMLVDNSIVVLEAIARVREELPTLDRRGAAVRGAREIASSVVASTLTTVAVFFPMAFLTGVSGQLVRDLAYAVSFSIISSMLVSLTVVPVLQSLGDEGGLQGSHGAPDPGPGEAPAPRAPLAWLVVIPALLWRAGVAVVAAAGWLLGILAFPLTRGYEALEAAYPASLRLALRLRTLVLVAAVGLCGAAVLVAQGLGQNMIPEVRQGEFFVQLQLPAGTSLEHSAGVTRRLASRLEADPRVDMVFARVGSVTQGGSAAGSQLGSHLAQINVRLVEEANDEEGHNEAALFELVEAAAGAEVELRLGRPSLFSFEAPIEIRVYADRTELSVAHARRLLPDLVAISALEDVLPDDLAGRPEVDLRFDRERLGALGITVDEAAAAVQRAVQGELAAQPIHAQDEQLDLRIQLPRVDRARVEDVRKIVVSMGGDEGTVPVRLAAVAEIEPTVGPSEIRRIDGRRGLRIQARLGDADLAAVAEEVEAVLARHEANIDPAARRLGLSTQVAGQASEMGASMRSMVFTALISIFLVYVVMASSFESLHHPFLIMFTVPLAIVGVVFAVALTGLSISAMVGIGAIILGGIVVNNAIVMINAINARRGRGLEVDPAIIEGAHTRVRPILMTTATTVLGLLPMAIGVGDGAALRQPLAVAVIGGLTVSTLLTLYVIPCMYSLVPGRRRDAWAESRD